MAHLPATQASEVAAQGGASEPTRPEHLALEVVEFDRNGERQTSRRVEGLAENEIRSLLWLEEPENKLFARAYKAWQKKDTLFAGRIDKKRKQSNSILNEIYQLIGFYSVFQGVLLTAVAQSNLLHFNNWWTAFFLSLLASLVTIGGVVQKFLAILALEKTIKSEETTRRECISRARKLIQKREKFDFDKDAADAKGQSFHLAKLRASAIAVLAILVFFSGLFLASIYEILCHPDSTS